MRGAAALKEMARVFDTRFYVELQRHGLPAQAVAEPGLVAWAYDNDIPLVATNDVYFAKSEMWRAHDALMCIADGAFIGQEDRRRVTAEHWFKSAAEMRILFARSCRRPATTLWKLPGAVPSWSRSATRS